MAGVLETIIGCVVLIFTWFSTRLRYKQITETNEFSDNGSEHGDSEWEVIDDQRDINQQDLIQLLSSDDSDNDHDESDESMEVDTSLYSSNDNLGHREVKTEVVSPQQLSSENEHGGSHSEDNDVKNYERQQDQINLSNFDKEDNYLDKSDKLMEVDQSQDHISHFEGKYFLPIESCELDFQQIRRKFSEGNILFMNGYPDQFSEDLFEPITGDIKDIWDSRHVKMPFSERNQVFGQDLNKCQIINEQLNHTFHSGADVEYAIKSFNDNLAKFDFDVLREFIDNNTYSDVLEIVNKISEMALELPSMFNEPIPLLRKSDNRTLFFSQEQIACLLANGFFCTFPRRSKANKEYENYPLFNFASLYSSGGNPGHYKTKTEKLKCIFNYFNRILTDEQLCGSVSFERRSLSPQQMPEWSHSDKVVTEVRVENSGRMEIDDKKYSVVDFANKFIGGGVLSSGSVQEEILFLISPELIVARLFSESMDDNEAIIMSGHSVFNTNDGYSKTFKWTGDFNDRTKKDELGRKFSQIIAMDALDFNHFEEHEQFGEEFIKRELNKAYIAFFSSDEFKNRQSPAIVSGKWGCGAFKGDPSLKFLIQLMAASEANRRLILYTFNDKELGQRIVEFNKLISTKNLTVKHLYGLICDFINQDYPNIFDFINDCS